MDRVNYRKVGPKGLEKNIGERVKILFPKRNDFSLRNNVWGVIVENPLNYSDNHTDYSVRVRFGDVTGRFSRYIPIEHGSNIRIHTLAGIQDYVFIDDSD